MLAGFALVTASLTLAPVRALDLAVRDLADGHRTAGTQLAAEWVNRLGSGGILAVAALAVAVGVAWLRRSAWPVAPVLAAFALTGLIVGPLKLLTHRAAPHSPLPDDAEVRLLSQDGGLSYPSGHAVNTIVWYAVICLLMAPWLSLGARRFVRWLPPVVVVVTATYLGHHWLTDMAAGICLGVLIARALARVPWPALGGPPRAGHPPTPLHPRPPPHDHRKC
jgi:membrane-associated phospholipid phosphatase